MLSKQFHCCKGYKKQWLKKSIISLNIWTLAKFHISLKGDLAKWSPPTDLRLYGQKVGALFFAPERMQKWKKLC